MLTKGGPPAPEFSLLTEDDKETQNMALKDLGMPLPKVPTNASREGVRVYEKVQLFQMVQEYANEVGVDPELAVKLVYQESRFNQFIKGRPVDRPPHNGASAEGLMQFMPTTAVGEGVQNSFDADDAIPKGLMYLKKLLRLFDGDVRLALAAYNAGPGLIKRLGYVPDNGQTLGYVNDILGYTMAGIIDALGITGSLAQDRQPTPETRFGVLSRVFDKPTPGSVSERERHRLEGWDEET
jgi:soluble lytic murein transglycosylase-like protein